jgi:uncharacterized protein YjhX (UPF0386 family)
LDTATGVGMPDRTIDVFNDLQGKRHIHSGYTVR